MEKVEVTAEVHFAQKLASNEKKIRDRAIKRLQKYLSVRSTNGGLSDADLLKIWKGLHYCMWMQDKPLIQEELSQRITNLIHCFPSTGSALGFVRIFFETQAREWNGIDRLRLDKFMMMVRDMLHQTLTLLSKEGWPAEESFMFAKLLHKTVMQYDQAQLPDGLKIHLADIYIDELGKVSLEKMTSKIMLILLGPFIHFILHSNKIELVKRMMLDVVYRAVNTFTDGVKIKPIWEKKPIKKKKCVRRHPKGVKDNKENSGNDEEVMEVEDSQTVESEDTQPSFVLDKRLLLLLLFSQAENKSTRAPNRAVVYKFVKKYPEENEGLTKMLDSLNRNEIVSDADDLRSLSSTLLYDDGKAMDKQQKRKKKRGKKKKREMEEDTDGCSISGTICSPQEDSSHTLVSNSHSKLEETKLITPSKFEKTGKKPKQAVAGSNTVNSMTLLKDVNIKGKSFIFVDRLEGSVTNGSLDGKVTKKRKRLSSGEDGTPGLPSKKSKLSVPNKLNTQSEMVETLTKDENTNSNARPRSSSPPKSDSKALKAGRLTKKARTVSVSPSPKTKSKKKDEETYESSSLSSIFTTPVQNKKGTKGKSPATSSKSPDTSEPKSSMVDELVGDLYSVISGSCSMVKKAIGFVSSNTDPGPSNTNYKVKSHSTPGVYMTPGNKKKVVFDLRKNRANKFQDYLKSLAKQPEPPYEPSKSPSVGILKSPVLSNVTLISENKSDSDISELSQTCKTKKKTNVPKSRSPGARSVKRNVYSSRAQR
ncbi:ribosomal RNA processing protein 1 homolog B-like isoform X2 [Physella acuta]|uniref:ribosomal RNA processing protein 1 homolog B-like isoform X2 n=1 Tax=Physella acuta TaxID=109671 RepID=UPI0027DB5ACF|nr:ribosomal RNA processing protein 1 homolog B-like isoform X2 [Physella acuta]